MVEDFHAHITRVTGQLTLQRIQVSLIPLVCVGLRHLTSPNKLTPRLGNDPVVIPPTGTQPTAGSEMAIPQISIQPVEGPSKVSSPDIMKGIVESGVYDKVLAGTEKKAGGKFHKIRTCSTSPCIETVN